MSSMKNEHFLFPGGPAHTLEYLNEKSTFDMQTSLVDWFRSSIKSCLFQMTEAK